MTGVEGSARGGKREFFKPTSGSHLSTFANSRPHLAETSGVNVKVIHCESQRREEALYVQMSNKRRMQSIIAVRDGHQTSQTAASTRGLRRGAGNKDVATHHFSFSLSLSPVCELIRRSSCGKSLFRVQTRRMTTQRGEGGESSGAQHLSSIKVTHRTI